MLKGIGVTWTPKSKKVKFVKQNLPHFLAVLCSCVSSFRLVESFVESL